MDLFRMKGPSESNVLLCGSVGFVIRRHHFELTKLPFVSNHEV